MAEDPHLTVDHEVQILADRVVCTETWQGSFDRCLQKVKAYCPGHAASCESIQKAWPVAVSANPVIFCAGASVRRTSGDVGVATITMQAMFNACIVGLENTEVSKPIETWGQDEEREEDRPDLSKIEKWKALKDDDPDNYYGMMVDGEELDGKTKKLAQKILDGIESYSAYVPVITITTTYYRVPEGASGVGERLGKSETPEMPSGYHAITGNKELPTGVAKEWVKTMDRASINNDATMTRVEGWSGFSKVDKDLYKPVSGEKK